MFSGQADLGSRPGQDVAFAPVRRQSAETVKFEASRLRNREFFDVKSFVHGVQSR